MIKYILTFFFFGEPMVLIVFPPGLCLLCGDNDPNCTTVTAQSYCGSSSNSAPSRNRERFSSPTSPKTQIQDFSWDHQAL